MLNSSALTNIRQTDTDKINRDTLVDIKSIEIDTSLPVNDRMLSYLEQIKNPYCFLCGETLVKIKFAEEGKTLDEAVKNHFLGLKEL